MSGTYAIYGWHRPSGQPIQPVYTGHSDDWVDYSHRLTSAGIGLDSPLPRRCS